LSQYFNRREETGVGSNPHKTRHFSPREDYKQGIVHCTEPGRGGGVHDDFLQYTSWYKIALFWEAVTFFIKIKLNIHRVSKK